MPICSPGADHSSKLFIIVLNVSLYLWLPGCFLSSLCISVQCVLEYIQWVRFIFFFFTLYWFSHLSISDCTVHWLETYPPEATKSFQMSISFFFVLPNENNSRLLPQPEGNVFSVENSHLCTSEALVMFPVACIKPLASFWIAFLP